MNFTKNIKLVFVDIDVKETSFVNRVVGRVYLDDQDPIDVEAASKETEVRLSFNLDVRKEISRILLNGEEVDISDPKLAKVGVHKKELDSTDIKVEYLIKVINTESIDGSATVVESIPSDMIYVPDESDLSWVEDEDGTIKAETGKIKAGEEKEFKIVFAWTGGENALGLKSNSVKLEDVKGEEGFEEADDKDNQDTAELLIELKTGDKTFMIISAGIFIILLELGAIVIISRKKRE